MNESLLVEKLMHFALTRQEATIYLCLVSNEKSSGYEVSKITGISRSNVYSALARLVEEGAAYLLEGDTNKYIAVDIEEFCNNKIRQLVELRGELKQELPKIGRDTEGYITISTHKHIMDKVHNMLAQVEHRVYISMPTEYLEKCRAELEKLISDGKKVVILAPEQVDFPGSITYVTTEHVAQIRLIVDSEYVLTGDMSGSASDSCLYCGQKNFVNVFKEALRNEIRLIEITGGEK